MEGKLLSQVDSSLPGSLVWFDSQYKFGKKQGGLNPNDTLYDLSELPVFKACSHAAGGALFLTINAGDHTNAHIKFWAAATKEDLFDKGGSCPASPTPAPTAAPTPVRLGSLRPREIWLVDQVVADHLAHVRLVHVSKH